MKKLILLPVLLLFINASCQSLSQEGKFKKVENIVYGMVSGTALLMDEYVPANSIRKAIVFIQGSAFGFVYPDNYDQPALKENILSDTAYIGRCILYLLQNGYTVFTINHRFTPKFQYRDIIDDCQRSVRYIRYHAKEFNIDPGHIGSMGLSSGGNLAAMLGVSDHRNAESKSPVDSVSSRVQAVVTLAAPFNLADFNKIEDSAMANNFILSVLGAYMGSLPKIKSGDFVLSGKFLDASPVAQVTSGAAPTLIYYSDNDPVIPTRHAKEMVEKLMQNNVAAKIVARHLEEHSPVPDMAEVCRWFGKYLESQ